jgi:hypothetical protein
LREHWNTTDTVSTTFEATLAPFSVAAHTTLGDMRAAGRAIKLRAWWVARWWEVKGAVQCLRMADAGWQWLLRAFMFASFTCVALISRRCLITV